MKAFTKGIAIAVIAVGSAEILLPANPTEATAPIARTLEDVVRQTAIKYGVPPLLSEALIDVESNWNPDAMGYNVDRATGRVKSRDHGLMQVNDANIKRYGVSWLEMYENPEVNIELGTALLANCHKNYDTEKNKETKIRKTVACYNAGPGNLSAGYAHADKVLQKLKERLFKGL